MGVTGVEPAHLTPQFWLALLDQPDRAILSPAAVAAYNARVTRFDPHVHDLGLLPAVLSGDAVVALIRAFSDLPACTLYDVDGLPIQESVLRSLVDDLALASVPADVHVRFGLAVRRAALRTFPTTLSAFTRKGDTDVDRLQESALVPGTPVAVLHASRDGQWCFVEAPRYRAWVRKQDVGIGSRDRVFGYCARAPSVVITGAVVHTSSDVQLDMGTRVPLAADQEAFESSGTPPACDAFSIELPARDDNGGLVFVRARLPNRSDARLDYLPLTRANIIKQAFKFVGERYCWGNVNNGRDCSGFVSDVYRSMGVLMPRNTHAQSASPAADRRTFDASASDAERKRAVELLEVGDLIYVPGHVTMMIGRVHGQPYVIHNTLEVALLGLGDEFECTEPKAVTVTPLLPLLTDDRQRFIDCMTAIVRIGPHRQRGAEGS